RSFPTRRSSDLTVLLGFTTFLLLFYIVDYGFMSYLRGILTSQYSTWSNGEEIVTDRLAYLVPSLYNENIVYAFFVPFLLNAIFLLGSIYFAKSRSEEHTSELQSRENLVCRLLLEIKKN